MSAKNRDRHGRWRSKTIAFRVSDEENRAIEEAISLSGMTKQDYIIRKLMNILIAFLPESCSSQNPDNLT